MKIKFWYGLYHRMKLNMGTGNPEFGKLKNK